MKEWKGLIEKEFTIVHFAAMRIDTNKKRHYKIVLNPDESDPAKTPPIFTDEGVDEIENDYSLFLEKMNDKLNN